MDARVLVAYATKYGATVEIAEKIGQVLSEAGLPADVLPVAQVTDLAPYRAVVLGSAVYMFHWRKEAVKFLKAHQAALAERPVWLFSSGPLTEGDPVEELGGWRFPEAQRPLADRIRPRDMAVFHGNVTMDKLNAVERWTFEKFGDPDKPLGDFRDWQAIAAWAEGIAAALKEPAA